MTIGLPVDFGPNGIQFSKPVMIGIPYDQDQLAAKGITDLHQLKIFYYSMSDYCWKDLPIKLVDTVNQLILAEVTHFTVFQLGYPTETKVLDDNTTDDGSSGSSDTGKGWGGCFIEIISLKWY